MNTILFATSNKAKIKYAQMALNKLNVKVKQTHFDFNESRSSLPEVIALEKAKQAYKILKTPVIVEDSGFFIKALRGFPMTHIHFVLDTIGVKHILQAMQGEKNRTCYWESALAYVDGRTVKTFTFREYGSIATTLRPKKRKMMSELWHIYIPTSYNPKKLALSEMTATYTQRYNDKNYNQHNHFNKFANWITVKNK